MVAHPAMRRGSRRVGPAAPATGFVTLGYVYAVALSLLLFTLLANLIVVSYGRGVVRAAVDEGVRAGARVTSSLAAAEAVCAEVANDVRVSLLGGRLGERVRIRCAAADGRMTATAVATLDAWLPLTADFSFTAEASSRQETLP